ncbi:MAG TPA: hypothetical protein VLE89_03455 [Chlamydiales bacterium]|nr:hypothetical protein [Chlamydiales bacterium]
MRAVGVVAAPDGYQFGRFEYEVDAKSNESVGVRISFVREKNRRNSITGIVLTPTSGELKGTFTFTPFVPCLPEALQAINYLRVTFASPITFSSEHAKID